MGTRFWSTIAQHRQPSITWSAPPMRQPGTTARVAAGTAGGSPAHAAQLPISPPHGAGTHATAGASRQTSQRWPGMDVSVLGRGSPGSKAAGVMRRPLVSCRRIGSRMGSLIPYRPLDLPAVLCGLRPARQRRTEDRSCSPGKFRRTSGEKPNSSTRWSRACAASCSVGNSPTLASRPCTRTYACQHCRRR